MKLLLLGMAKIPSRVNDIVLGEPKERSQPKQPAASGSAKQAEQEFAQFYNTRDEVELPELMRQARKQRIWRYVTVALAVLLGLAVAGFFVFNRGGAKFGEEAVDMQLSAPPQAPSGEVVAYVLTYHNDQSVALGGLEVDWRYPDGFTVVSVEPKATNEKGTNIVVGRVPARGTGTITVRGRLVGNVGEQKPVVALIAYEPDNVRAQFSKTLSASTEVVASVLHLDVIGPPQAFGTQPVTFVASYRNDSTTKLTGIVLGLTAPAGFVLDVPRFEPLPGSDTTWKLPDLEPQAESKVEFIGHFSDSAALGNQEFRFRGGLLANGSTGGTVAQVTSQEERVVTLQLARSRLTLQLTANDVSLKSAADLGDEMRYELIYANEGDTPLSNPSFTLKVDPRYVDWASLGSDGTALIDKTVGTIRWTKATLPLLASLEPAARGSLSVKFNLVTGLPPGVTALAAFSAQGTAEASQLVGTELKPVTIVSNEVVTKINTRFSLVAEGRYYTDELVKLGSGPLPPQVGLTTSYVISWRLGNTLNDVEQVEVTTTLPQGVAWTNQSTVTAGEIVTYNPNTREVSWRLNKLPAGAGSAYAKPEATFEVAITPSEQDVDKVLVLTKTSTATGRDSFSGTDLITTAKLITTDLDGDLGAQGKGVVIR